MLAHALRVDVEIRSELDELDFGEWTGLDETEISIRFPAQWSYWRQDPLRARIPGGESLHSLGRRVRSSSLLFAERTVVVAHETVLRIALCHLLLHDDLHHYRAWDFAPGSYAILLSRDGGWTLGALDSPRS